MALQCQDPGPSIQYSVVTTVQKLKWWIMYTGLRCFELAFQFNETIPAVLLRYDFWGSMVSDTWQLFLNEKVAIEGMYNRFWFLYNLEPKHLQEALWSCQNSIKTFIFTSHKSPFPYWLSTFNQKWEVLCLWLHSPSPPGAVGGNYSF